MDQSMPQMASIASGGFCTPRTPTGMAPSETGPIGFLPDAPLTPPSMPPVVEGISRTGIVHRGEPPSLVPPPSFMSGQEPPPQPPPKEDDAVFLRRARLHYMERAAKAQQD